MVFGIAIGAVLVLAFLVFPGIRKKAMVLVRGFLNVFVEDLAKTPEGAKAVYADAIEKCQEKYNQAKDTYDKFAGELAHKRIQVNDLNKQLKDVESKCEGLVRAGKMDEARVFSQRRSEIIDELELIHRQLEQLEPRVQEAQGVHAMYEKKLMDLKREARMKVEEMRLNNDMKDLISDLDDLKRESATDKMLGAVRDGSKELEKQVMGGMIVHSQKASTKIAKAEAVAKTEAADDYLMSLQAKYTSKPALKQGGQTFDVLSEANKIKAKTPTKR